MAGNKLGNTCKRVAKRRREMCALVFRGWGVAEVAEKLSDKYDAAACTIESDWSRRSTWMPEIFGIQSGGEILLEVIAEFKDLKGEFWKMAHNSDKDSDKITALREVKQTNKDIIGLLQDTGLIKKAAQKILIGDEEEEEFVGPSPREKLAQTLAKMSGNDVIDITPKEKDEEVSTLKDKLVDIKD